MTQQEHDREDLLREATALVERVELRVAGSAEPIIVGFRRGGQASVFFGGDPVYQFSCRNELRRVFAAGRLLKAESGRLVLLERHRAAGKLQLVQKELDAVQSDELLTHCRQQLAMLATQLAAGSYNVVAQEPPDADVVSLVCQWLAALPERIAVARRPHVA